MDAFYIGFVVLSSLSRGVIPFIGDFNSALENMERWGGGLEFMLWMGLVTQLSVLVSGVLFCWGRSSAVYLAVVQIPFRILFVIPSISLILLLSDTSTWVWLGFIVFSEGVKGYSLWWLWRKRGVRLH